MDATNKGKRLQRPVTRNKPNVLTGLNQNGTRPGMALEMGHHGLDAAGAKDGSAPSGESCGTG
jgi:hypothetical protein